MMPDNDYYGHRTAMARYCGCKQLSPAVFGSIRHGWHPDLCEIDARRMPSAPIFVWNEREQRQADDRGIPNVIAIGAPFLYGVSALGAGANRPPSGAGTIVFPLHSGGAEQTRQNHQRLIEDIERHEEGPFTVSIYYQDHQYPDHVEPYRRAGWRMVTFGTRNDPMFMSRLILELEAHHAVVSDALCSALWYGAHLGRRIRVLGPPPHLARQGVASDFDYSLRWPDIYADGVEGSTAMQLAATELGVSSMRPPDELAELLGWRSWRRYAAPLVRMAIDARHGNDLRRGQPLARSARRGHGS